MSRSSLCALVLALALPTAALAEPAERIPAVAAQAPAVAPDPFDDDLDFDEDWLAPDPSERDPLEPVNRGVFRMNEEIYDWFFDPIARVYEIVMPDPGRRAVRRVFDNLNEPVVFVNQLLQLSPLEAGETGARFVVNTTVGIVGIFDPAGFVGLEATTTDFGETLGVYRIGSGPYLVIPVLGPSTLRDALGEIVDTALRPDTWLLPAGQQMILGAGSGLATYDIERVRLDALRETSVDFYAALRGAYLMDRDALIEARIEELYGSD